MSSSYFLVDCNNFYASCERLFNPSLRHKPVVVLSNNDGCIIARSNEAKALGIPMGAPFYQYREQIRRQGVAVFSSNYTLYGDISQRVMSTLHSFCKNVEVYSIDEAFLQFQDEPWELEHCARDLRQKIHTWVGIPVSIGIAPTKTLAKIANRVAKNQAATQGVFDLRDPQQQAIILRNCATKDIWGIGNRLAERLKPLGITTALHLRDYPTKMLRKHFGVMVERTALELKGIACLSLEMTKPRKNIIASRSFGRYVTEWNDLAAAISQYTARACTRLREQDSVAQGIQVFITTNPFQTQNPHYQNSKIQTLVSPTADTSLWIHAAKKALQAIYRPNYAYKKAGIMLLNIIPATMQQRDCFMEHTESTLRENTKRNQLMSLMDKLNAEQGSKTLFLAAEGVNLSWTMRSGLKSDRFTTDWQELAQVIA